MKGCAVCGLDPRTGRVGDVASDWLCPTCEDDPANADWFCGSELERLGGIEDVATGSRLVEVTLSEVVGRAPARSLTEGQARVIRIIAEGPREVRRWYYDHRGHRHGTRVYKPALTVREIARLAGVSKSTADRVRRGLLAM